MELNFLNFATIGSTLTAAISASATTIEIQLGDYQRFLEGTSSGYIYAVMKDVSNYEIVKIDVANSDHTGLSVSRGEEGTAARAWPRGTVIFQDLTAATLDNFVQKATHRTVTYNPNGVLTVAYTGEKVYQSDLLLWWKGVSGTEWRLIVGVKTIATPTLSPAAGSYSNGQTITLSCATSGATIRYTTDGATPDENSTLYSTPFAIPDDSTTTVKARAFHSDRWWTESAVGSAAYTTPYFCVWVGNVNDDTVSRVNISTNVVDATVSVGNGPNGVAFDGTHVWVANLNDDTVSKINIATNVVDATVSVGNGPNGVAFDGTHVWVANYIDDTVSKINIATNVVDATVNVGADPNGVAFDGTHVWVANYIGDTVSKVNISTNVVDATVNVGNGAYAIVFDDNAHVWVANFNDDTVSRVNISTNVVDATVNVGNVPSAVAFDGTHVWAANYYDTTVSKINITTNVVDATIDVGGRPNGVAFDGTHVWVAIPLSNVVKKVNISTNVVDATVSVGDTPKGIVFDG